MSGPRFDRRMIRFAAIVLVLAAIGLLRPRRVKDRATHLGRFVGP
jgi:hypothetical protein